MTNQLQMVVYERDRRKKSAGPPPEDGYTEGLKRIDAETLQTIAEQDKHYETLDRKEWLKPNFHEHVLSVTKLVDQVSKLREVPPHRRALQKFAALHHDDGKLKAPDFRRRARWSESERAQYTRIHPILSVKYLEEKMAEVRPAERIFIQESLIRVRCHHIPWEVTDPEVRSDCFDIHFCDTFQASREERETPGLKLPSAIEALMLRLRNIEDGRDPNSELYRPHLEMVRESVYFILKVHEGAVALMPDA